VRDGPAATLAGDGVARLRQMGQHMAVAGVGVLYVTHHLGEVFRVADRVSVFRDGGVVGSGPVGDFDHDGHPDLVAGNVGLNYTYTASRDTAFGVYAADFTGMTSDLTTTQAGVPYFANLLSAIADGSYNFVNPAANTAAVRAFIAPTSSILRRP